MAQAQIRGAVAQAKAEANAKFYEELEDAKRDTDIFRIAKYRNNTTKDICKPRYIKDKQGKILTNDKDIGERWREYYRQLLNENFPFSNFSPEPAIAGPVQSITEIEVEDALNHMAKGKATGPDEIPVEIWKRLGNCGVRWLSELFNKILIDQCIPQRWRESYLTPFYKNKGDTRNCENYRAIKLISHTFKMWEKIINNRLKDLTSVSENQCGFVSGKSTIDAIHAIRTLMEKYDYNKQDLHFLFIDMEKAFDRVPRDLIWRAVRSQGVPEYYVEILKDMYDNIRTKVRGPFGVSGDFEVTMGVHQGSALSPLLFNLVMDYVTAGLQRDAPWNILYADDVVLVSESQIDLQNMIDEWRSALEKNGLKISRSKTAYMYCNFSQLAGVNPVLYIDEEIIQNVKEFKYLGSVISCMGDIEDDVVNRVNNGWMKWRSLSGVLCDRHVPIKLKGKVYKTAVRPAMLYGSECWAAKKQHEQKLHTNEMKMLRWAGGITLLDKIQNQRVR